MSAEGAGAAGTEPAAQTRAALDAGRRLFNEARFFQAHEVWEEAWLRESGDTKRLLQGLIQIAAGYHQAFDRGAPRGCRRLLEAGREKLDSLAGNAAGLALAEFRDALALSLGEARAWEAGEAPGLSPDRAPRLGLSKE